MKTRTITVKLKEWPSGASENDVAGFIIDALETWGGQRHPDDPLFSSLRIDGVTVGKTTLTLC